MKPKLIAVGYIALGILAIFLIGLLFDRISPPACVGTMAVMILAASELAYSEGKKEGRKALRTETGQRYRGGSDAAEKAGD